MNIILTIIIAIFLIYLGLTFVLAFIRNKHLKDFSELRFYHEFTDKERKALVELWKYFKANKIPDQDPLRYFSEEEILELISKLSIQARGEIFSGGEISDKTFFLASLFSALDKGFTQKQALILAGIIFHHMGPVIDEYIKLKES